MTAVKRLAPAPSGFWRRFQFFGGTQHLFESYFFLYKSWSKAGKSELPISCQVFGKSLVWVLE
jgi:hypothetical protein